MRKFLVMLMVVAMASFLFVGCLPVTPPIDPVDPGPGPALPPPIILDIQKSDGVTSIVDLTATTTQYINKVEAGTSILVRGIAYPEALVKVYICSAATPVAVGEATKTGLFSVAVAETALGADSSVAKTLHVTSKEIGLAESVASNVATFILDTVAPGIEEVKATASVGYEVAKVTNDPVRGLLLAITDPCVLSGTEGQTVIAGDWTIIATGSHTDVDNVAIITPSNVKTTYTVIPGGILEDEIPGIKITFALGWEKGDTAILTTIAEKGVLARATLKFNEDITYAAAMAGTYGGTITKIGDPYAYKETINTGYWTSDLEVLANSTFTITVYDVKDSAGNVGGTSAVPLTKSAIVGAASAILLKP
ncbi:hypothetical protein ES705_42812 [subsurface metagenome]